MTTDCPYCDESGSRMAVHHHLLESHDEVFEQRDGALTYACPECGDESVVEPGTAPEESDPVERFGRELKMLAFDALLDHLEQEHGY
jgi:predicted RNA-binding Zn-ribbon protein involved in translation (DUF1610 family)